MIRWDARCEYFTFDLEAGHLTRFVSTSMALGDDGWELVSVTPVAGTRDLLAFYKRVRPDVVALREPQ